MSMFWGGSGELMQILYDLSQLRFFKTQILFSKHVLIREGGRVRTVRVLSRSDYIACSVFLFFHLYNGDVFSPRNFVHF